MFTIIDGATRASARKKGQFDCFIYTLQPSLKKKKKLLQGKRK